MSSRVAIVSAGARTALGEDLDGTWRALLAGRSAVAGVQGFDASGFGDPYAAQIWSELPSGEDDPAMRILGRHGHLLERVVTTVHEQGRAEDIVRERLGLFVSMGVVDSVIDDLAPAVVASRDEEGRLDYARFFAGAYRQVHPLWPLAMLNNVAAGQISIDLDLRGDSFVLSSESDGGIRAILEGIHAVRDGSAEAVIAGGVSEALSPMVLARLRIRGVLGDGPLRPCAADGAGTSPGEGAAAFLLKPEMALGTEWPLAFLRGGATAWGLHADRPGPTRDAFERAIAGALDASGVSGDEIDVVFLHAEGRADQDRAEAEAVRAVCGVRARWVATKGALGHAGSGAPALDLAVAVRALADGMLPPCTADGALLDVAKDSLVGAPEAASPRRVLLVAAGAHGGTGALVLEAAR